jgi:hypothetical protein
MGYLLGAVSPEKVGRGIIDHIGRPLAKKIASAFEGGATHAANHCSAVNSPGAVVNCGPKESESKKSDNKVEPEIADATGKLSVHIDQSGSSFAGRWPQENDPETAEHSLPPKESPPQQKPEQRVAKKLPPWHYAYAIDYYIKSEGDDGEPELVTIWISCAEKPSSPRVAELCAETPEHRKKHHLLRSGERVNK